MNTIINLTVFLGKNSMPLENDDYGSEKPRKPLKDEASSFDSADIINWVLIPGIIGIICSIIIGRIIPTIMLSMGAGQGGKGIGANISRMLDSEFNSLTEIPLFENPFFWVMVFGFLFGVLIKYIYSDDRVK